MSIFAHVATGRRTERCVLVQKEAIFKTDPDAPQEYKIIGYYSFEFLGTDKGYKINIVPREQAYVFPTEQEASTVRDGDDRLKTFVIEPA